MSTNAVGVPRAGVTNVGDVTRAKLPVPETFVAESVVKVPAPGVVPPMAPGAAQVFPSSVLALIVPVPDSVIEQPVPQTIAAVVFVAEVREANDGAPPPVAATVILLPDGVTVIPEPATTDSTPVKAFRDVTPLVLETSRSIVEPLGVIVTVEPVLVSDTAPVRVFSEDTPAAPQGVPVLVTW